MPVDLVGKIDLDLIYRPFLDRWLTVVAKCRDDGFQYRATLGFRTYAEQDALFAQGRTTPGKRVTKAAGGYSMHCFGLAVDHARVLPSGKVDWSAASYDRLGVAARSAGLQWSVPGLSDLVHVQAPAYVWFGLQEHDLLAACRAEYAKGGLPAVWKRLDLSLKDTHV